MSGFLREDALAHERYLSDLAHVVNPHLSPVEGSSRKIKHRDFMARLKNIAQRIDETPALEYLSVVTQITNRR